MAVIGPNRDDWSELQCVRCNDVLGERFGAPLPDLYCVECAKLMRWQLEMRQLATAKSG